jgi:hypothetical protein
MLSETEASHEQSKASLDQLSQQVVTFQGDATSDMQTKKGQIETYQEQSDGVGQSFDERKEAVVSDYDSLQDDVTAKIGNAQQEFETLKSDASDKQETLSTTLESTNSSTISAFQTLLLDTLISQLTGNSEALSGAMEFLESIGNAGQELMDGGLGDVMESIEGVLEVIEAVKPVLESVEALLG